MKCSLTLLQKEKVVSCLQEKDAPSTVTFMQDGSTSRTATAVQEFLTLMFGKNKNFSQEFEAPMASSVSRSDTSRLVVMEIFKISGTSIQFIQFISTKR